MKLFDPEGPLMTALGKLADLVFCNILFCIFSLPVFTIGASLTALYDCTLSIVDDVEEQLIFQQFWRSFRTNFKRATLLWLICLAVIGLLALYNWAVGLLSGMMYRAYRVTFYVLLFLFLAGAQYIFPLQARYDLSVKATLKNAWLLSAAALPMTLPALAVPVLAFYLSFIMNPGAFAIMFFLWVFVVLAVIAYLDSFFYRRAFRKLPQPKQGSGKAP